MSPAARVTSLEAIQVFRERLVEFGIDGRDALGALEYQVHRAVDWLAEKTQHWQRQIRERREEFHRAKLELDQRKYENRDGRGRGTTEPEKNFRKAQLRLQEAESKLALCKRWKPLLEHAVHEYFGPTRALAGALDTDLRLAVALLDQKIAAVEAYLQLAPPTAAPLAPASAAAPLPVAAPAPPPEALPQPEPEGKPA